MSDPFAVLGLDRTATLDDVRAARRRLAHEHHPDHGGDPAVMKEVNRAFDLAVKELLHPPPVTPVSASPTRDGAPPRPAPPSPRPRFHRVRHHIQHDAPSFSIDVLPVEAFEALAVVATWNGEVINDDPPYLLDAELFEPYRCWCRLELLPEAGATMVSLTVVAPEGDEAPSVEDVRDLWISMLNDLGRVES
jgi:hypothetical protein